MAIPLVLAIGALIGLVNGLIHVRLRIPSFMASLAMGFVGTGAAILLTGGDIVKINDDVGLKAGDQVALDPVRAGLAGAQPAPVSTPAAAK